MAGDPNYQYRKLQVRGNGVAGLTTFVDLSPSPLSLTNNGGVVISSGLTQFGENMAYFNGTSGALLISATDARWGLLTDTFTIAFWAKPTAMPASGNWCRLFMFGGNNDPAAFTIQISDAGRIIAAVPHTSGAGGIATSDGAFTTDALHYYELSVSSGTARIFKDGAVIAGPSTLVCPTSSAGQTIRIGSDIAATVNTPYTGYLFDVIIDAGAARHTAAYSNPTALIPDYVAQVSGTIRDGSGAACARTVHLIDRASGAFVGSTTSNATTGAYLIKTASTNEVCRIVLDDAGGILQNDLIDRVIPA